METRKGDCIARGTHMIWVGKQNWPASEKSAGKGRVGKEDTLGKKPTRKKPTGDGESSWVDKRGQGD